MTVVPGFQDAHVHTPFAGLNRLRVWLQRCGDTWEDCLRIIADMPPHTPADGSRVVDGSMPQFPGTPHRGPRRNRLRPTCVPVQQRDVHGAWVNSTALTRPPGSRRPRMDPPDGQIETLTRTQRAHGDPARRCAYWVNGHVAPPRARPGGNRRSSTASSTCTRWASPAGRTRGHPATQSAYRSLADGGRLTGRVVGALWWDRHRGLEQIEELRARRELNAPGSTRRPSRS